VLGLILAGAALNGPGPGTGLLLLAYGLGAATSLAVGIVAGKAILARARPSLLWAERARRGLGALVVLTAVAIGAGLDTGLLTRLSTPATAGTENALLAFAKAPPLKWDVANAAPAPRPRGPLAALDGGGQWLNTQPLDASALRGKVVLVNFWTYSCINCLRTLPYLEAWAEKYRAQGLVVVGVHAPEFAFERDVANVRRAVAMVGVRYPVVIDNDFRIWRAFNNNGWPAFYFVGADGRVRDDSLGEGDYAAAERTIQKLLAEAGAAPSAPAFASPEGQGALAAADPAHQLSPETYVGYEKAAGFASPGGFAPDLPHRYRPGAALARNAWSLEGGWTVGREFATSNAASGRLRYRFHARDLHLVAAAAQGHPVRFRVTIDGAAPGASHGADTDAEGFGQIKEPRLYQLVRQAGAVGDRTFEIEFLDPGARAYAFTFG
jgi:thiol-disulfide isomerase/thioredoxin